MRCNDRRSKYEIPGREPLHPLHPVSRPTTTTSMAVPHATSAETGYGDDNERYELAADTNIHC